MAERLRSAGFEPVEVPVIAIADPVDGGAALAEAAAHAQMFDAVVCASINAVTRWAGACAAARRASPPVAVVGPGSAAAARGAGLPIARVSPTALAESLVDVFPSGPGRALLVRAAETRGVIAPGLAAKGWRVDEVEAYRTLPAVPTPAQSAAARHAHAVAFTSGSTVRAFVSALGRESIPPVVVCIGPATAEAAEQLGVPVHAIAEPHTLDGLVAAVRATVGT